MFHFLQQQIKLMVYKKFKSMEVLHFKKLLQDASTLNVSFRRCRRKFKRQNYSKYIVKHLIERIQHCFPEQNDPQRGCK